MQEIRSRSNHVLPLEGILRDLQSEGLRKFGKESEPLKKIIAEKEHEVALLQDTYKKTSGRNH